VTVLAGSNTVWTQLWLNNRGGGGRRHWWSILLRNTLTAPGADFFLLLIEELIHRIFIERRHKLFARVHFITLRFAETRFYARCFRFLLTLEASGGQLVGILQQRRFVLVKIFVFVGIVFFFVFIGGVFRQLFSYSVVAGDADCTSVIFSYFIIELAFKFSENSSENSSSSASGSVVAARNSSASSSSGGAA